jgi:phosphoribosyl 1,2-cyclic phosphodiesterase
VNVWVLGSGSRGNAVLLECGDTRVLVDAGFNAATLKERLEQIGVAPESINGVVITHEHHDHVRGAATGARKWGWSLFATEGTTANYAPLVNADVRTFQAGATVTIGRLELRTVVVSHDAAEPVAIVATSTHTGVRAGIAYDLGHVPQAVQRAFSDLDVLVLEANHDEGMLRAGPYPPSVRARIAGPYGHLGNDAAGRMARDSTHRDLNHVVLAHLSESCNEARTAMTTVAAALGNTGFRGTMHVAPQDRVVGPFTARMERTKRAQQLAFGF